MMTSAMASVRKKWKSSPALIRFTWNETRRMIGSSRNARNGAPSTRATPARTCLIRQAFRGSAIGTVWWSARAASTRGVRTCTDRPWTGHNAGMALSALHRDHLPRRLRQRRRGRVRVGRAVRRAAPGRQRPGARGRHLPARPAAVRDDALLGDRTRRRARADGGVRPDLARRRQGRLLHAPSRTSRPRAPRLAASFDPVAVEALKASSVLDVSVGGPTLAAEAFRADLVDEVHLFLHPVLVGGGTRALPDDVHASLDLVAVDRIGEVVHLHHRVRR